MTIVEVTLECIGLVENKLGRDMTARERAMLAREIRRWVKERDERRAITAALH
jgi:hypothetical protein